MAIVCCICNKNQSGWITDYPLSIGLLDYRVCVKCYELIDRINKADNKGDVINEINSLSQSIHKPNIDKNVVEFIELFLQSINTENLNGETPENIAYQLMSKKLQNQLDAIQITSSFNFEGYTIEKYCGFISSEVALGMGLFKSIFASISNVFGTESNALKDKLSDAKKYVAEELKQQANELNANAIIGVDLEYTMFGDSIVAVIMSGTAVCIEKNK